MIPTIRTPGDRLADHMANGLFDELITCLKDATLALHQYSCRGERNVEESADERQARWDRESQERRELSDSLFGKAGEQFDLDIYSSALREKQIRHHQANQTLPESVKRRLSFLYARAFIFSLDTARKTLISLENFGDVAAAASAARATLVAGLPELEGVRHSTVHVDERIMQINRRGQPIVLQGSTNEANGIISGSIPVLAVGNLINDRFSCTLVDGSIGSVAVNGASLEILEIAVQQFADSVSWEGPPSLQPYI